jgi:hypothetical protein
MSWHSLYLHTTDTASIAATLRALLAAQGYVAYDPFPGGGGTPPGLRELVRQFVAPPQDGWVRVLGAPDEAVLPDLSRESGPVLCAWVTDEDGGFALYQDGARHTDPAAFAPFRHADKTPDLLARAFAGTLPVPVLEGDGDPPVMATGADDLPPELQQLAQEKGVNPRQASKLMQRLGGNLFGKLARGAGNEASDEQAQAREALRGGGDVWNSLGGQRVRAIASVLDLPSNWRQPTLDTLRDAYQVHRLRQRSPRMPLMPGDQEALDAVPDALAYRMVYLGRT